MEPGEAEAVEMEAEVTEAAETVAVETGTEVGVMEPVVVEAAEKVGENKRGPAAAGRVGENNEGPAAGKVGENNGGQAAAGKVGENNGGPAAGERDGGEPAAGEGAETARGKQRDYQANKDEKATAHNSQRETNTEDHNRHRHGGCSSSGSRSFLLRQAPHPQRKPFQKRAKPPSSTPKQPLSSSSTSSLAIYYEY
ncbi:hypothetical protein DM860_010187 [Cuscuta australis]|uniref:Uncharacterized protein n=1 Tax=Cuscuta australis TaxID=267555 RepID=A0A328DBX6_9ASTE|nr:hypothetical protein DM860_010187 [Cuscuta australis]